MSTILNVSSQIHDNYQIYHFACAITTVHLYILCPNRRTSLCRHHHRLVHEGGFGLSRTPAGYLSFTFPTGKPMADAPETRFRGNVFELVAKNRGSGIAITPKTPIPHWHGESMDDEIVIYHMLKRE